MYFLQLPSLCFPSEYFVMLRKCQETLVNHATNHVARWLEFWAFKDYLVALPSLQTHTVSICGSRFYLSPTSISPSCLSKET